MTNSEIIRNFNKPYQTVVAINCEQIGDDNDYSCFLSKACFELWNAGNAETALLLINTDPMLCGSLNMDELNEMMERRKARIAEENEMHSFCKSVYNN